MLFGLLHPRSHRILAKPFGTSKVPGYLISVHNNSLVLANHPPCSVPSKFRYTPGDAETPSFNAIKLGAFCCPLTAGFLLPAKLLHSPLT